eukprot:scaffold940_cov22-Tisochrysis_lutea.AAC.1
MAGQKLVHTDEVYNTIRVGSFHRQAVVRPEGACRWHCDLHHCCVAPPAGGGQEKGVCVCACAEELAQVRPDKLS